MSEKRMRRSGFTRTEFIVVTGIIFAAAVVMCLITPWHPPRENSYRAACQSNLKNIALGIHLYVQDSNDIFPHTNFNDAAIDQNHPLGWIDVLDPYFKTQQIFWCPKQIADKVRDRSDKKPSDRDFTDYFYNRNLAGIVEAKIKNSGEVILLGEGNDGTDAANARYSLNAFPDAWIKDEKSPIHRHLGGSNFAYLDGHVKWSKPDASTPTFAVR